MSPALLSFLDSGPPPIVFTLGTSAVWVARDFYRESVAAAKRLGRRAVLLIGDATIAGQNICALLMLQADGAPDLSFNSGSATPAGTIVRAKTLRLAWICLAISVASGAIWLLSVAASVSGQSFEESMSSDVLLTVVNETRFGLVSQIRFVMAVMVSGCLAYDRFFPARGLGVGLSVGLTAAIAWTAVLMMVLEKVDGISRLQALLISAGINAIFLALIYTLPHY